MSAFKETSILTDFVYDGSFLKVYKDVVQLPNGQTSVREWIKHPGAACMIPVLPDGKIGLIKQYRFPVQEEMIELPAGKLDAGEKPEECARRELEEEIGYNPGILTFVGNIHPAIGFASEKMWLFLAENLVKTKSNNDHDEFLELLPTNLTDALELVWNGRITDVKTIIGLLWAERLIK